MIITRDGETFSVTEDAQISEFIPKYGVTAKYKITVKGAMFQNTSLGGSRVMCLKGLLDQGFEITREPGDPDTIT